MQYMLLIYDNEGQQRSMSEEDRSAIMREYMSYTQALRDAGKLVAGDALHPTQKAKSVRLRDGELGTTDGPFAETKEQLGGYYLIDVESEDEALEWASKIPAARSGTIEVRPVVVFPVEATA